MLSLIHIQMCIRDRYEGTEEYGVPIIKDEVLEHYVKQALDDNMQILAHCNGDATGDQYLGAVEKMLPLSDNPNKENLRFTMIHCQTEMCIRDRFMGVRYF